MFLPPTDLMLLLQAEKARERIFGETPSEKQHLVLDATNSV
jgi:hypothetical protein